jgi:hypothetical protein
VNNSLDALLFFGFFSLLQLWGGAAIGAGLRERRLLPVLWGMAVGGFPLYFGFERIRVLGSWSGLTLQVFCLLGGTLAVGLRLPRLRAWLLRDGMNAVMIGTILMGIGAFLGASLLRAGSEALSILVGGIGFIFGAMWLGSGLRQLRGKQ